MTDYSKPNPALLEKISNASEGELGRFLTNATDKLPESRWFVDAIVAEQVERGGLRNMNAHSVREIILQYARKGETCTYKEIADALGLEWSQAHRRMPPILGEVSEMEYAQGRPLLTAIVVSQAGKCGNGFFEMAKREGANFTNAEQFQEDEQRRVFEHWKND